MLWYSHLFQNFPVCCDSHKGFGIVNKAERTEQEEINTVTWRTVKRQLQYPRRNMMMGKMICLESRTDRTDMDSKRILA